MLRRRPLVILLAALACAGAGCEGLRGGDPTSVVVNIKGEPFTLEIAADDATRIKGLMGREEIPEHGGMIFIFPRSQVRSFWMGNCLVDIDAIFLDPKGRVTATHAMTAESPRRADETDPAYRARLPSYSSVYPAQFVIELRAGSVNRLGVRVDDKIDLDVPRLKSLIR